MTHPARHILAAALSLPSAGPEQRADNAIRELAAQGFVIVPREATEEMIQAARGFCNNERATEFAWDAMIAEAEWERK